MFAAQHTATVLVETSQGLKWDAIYRYGIPALLWSAWNHTATSFWPTAILECRRPLNSCKIYCSLCNARNLSGKLLELLHPDAFLRGKICQKCVCSRSSAPDSAVGAYSTPQAPSLIWRGLLLSKSEGTWGRRWEGGRKGKGGGEMMKVKGHTGTCFSPLRALRPMCYHWDQCAVTERPMCYHWAKCVITATNVLSLRPMCCHW